MKNPIRIYMADLVHDQLPNNYVVPLNIAGIAAYTKKQLVNDVSIELFKSPTELLNKIKKSPPRILAFSNYMWNNNLSLQIAKHIKENLNIITIMGGPNIRPDKKSVEEFLIKNNCIDAYILFEGERPFANLIKTFINQDFAVDGLAIKGCSYLHGSELIYSEQDITTILSEIPSPYLTGWLDKFLKVKYTPLFETNRGCPYHCNYCAWGESILKKVRQFPMERVYAEMEYVASKNPNAPFWFIADANFGILKRDIDIAKRMRTIKDRTPALGRILLTNSKNSSDTDKQIAEILGDKQRMLIAVQTLDKEVQKAIGRPNPRQDDIPHTVKEMQQKGITIDTDVLIGLSTETYDSHLNTLKLCFSIGFDFIKTSNIIVLPGSRMDMPEERKKYGLITKYRLCQNSYGDYNGTRAIEVEEFVTGTSTMTEKEMLKFRMIHMLINFCWNTNFLKPVLKHLQKHHNINPIEIIKNITGKTKFHLLNRVLDRFNLLAINERFDSAEKSRDYYSEEDEFKRLMGGGFSKLNDKFTTEMILNNKLYQEFCDLMQEIACGMADMIPDDIFDITRGIIIDVHKLFYSGNLDKKLITDKITLYKKPEDAKYVKELLQKYHFEKYPQLAVEKALETEVQKFAYDIKEIK